MVLCFRDCCTICSSKHLVKHMSSVLAREGVSSIDFSVDSRQRTLSIGFWVVKHFICMPIFHCGSDVLLTKNYVVLM